MFQRILIPTDFSDSADRALALARTHFPSARRKIVHVLDSRALAVPDLTTGGIAPVRPPRDLQQTFAHEDEERLVHLAQPDEEHEVLHGDPVSGILQAAQAWDADLIVMGTQGRRGLAHFFLGSVAERVVRDSDIPVLTLRDTDAERR